MERWQNKIAVVTGASAGIGAAICKALVERDIIVVGLARRSHEMATTVKSSIAEDKQKNFHHRQCDVSCEENVKATFSWIIETFGGVDILINNAACMPNSSMLDENSSNDVLSTINTNVIGVVWCTREAFKSLRQRNVGGYVFMINSIVGHYLPPLNNYPSNVYPCSKYAVTAMTELLRREFLEHKTKIKITSISPGAVDTALTSDFPDIAKLNAGDIADAVVYCLQTPPHVQIHEMIIKAAGEQF